MHKYADILKIARDDQIGSMKGQLTGISRTATGFSHNPLIGAQGKDISKWLDNDPDLEDQAQLLGRQQAMQNSLKKFDQEQIKKQAPDYSRVLENADPIAAIYGDNNQ